LHGTHFDGSIDDIRIYNRALDSVEINSLYQEGGWSSLDQGLVASYPFNGNANDESGNDLHGTVNGALLTTDRFGNANSAYSFDGISDFINVPDDNSLDFTNQLSISVWVYLNDYTFYNDNDERVIIGKQRAVGGTGIIFTGLTYSATQLKSTFGVGNGTEGTGAYSDDTLSLQHWHNLVGVYNGTQVQLYKDGVLIKTESTTVTLLNSTQPLCIGKEGDINRNFKGKIDDVRIYNRALDSTEISDIYYENYCFETIYDTITTEVFDTTFVTVTDTLIIDAVLTGVNPPDNHNTLKIYPNPAKDFIIINTGDYSGMQNYSIKIVNLLGATVFETQIEQPEYEINLSTWTGKGVYVVKIFDNTSQEISVKKIVLQ